jgi:hypothetical protein
MFCLVYGDVPELRRHADLLLAAARCHTVRDVAADTFECTSLLFISMVSPTSGFLSSIRDPPIQTRH